MRFDSWTAGAGTWSNFSPAAKSPNSRLLDCDTVAQPSDAPRSVTHRPSHLQYYAPYIKWGMIARGAGHPAVAVKAIWGSLKAAADGTNSRVIPSRVERQTDRRAPGWPLRRHRCAPFVERVIQADLNGVGQSLQSPRSARISIRRSPWSAMCLTMSFRTTSGSPFLMALSSCGCSAFVCFGLPAA